MSAKSRPERRRDSRTATRKAGASARPAAPSRPAAKPPATRDRGGGYLNTLIVALLVVLLVMIAVFLFVVLRVTG